MWVHHPTFASHRTTSSSAEWSLDKPLSSSVKGHKLTVCDIVWVSALEHRSYEHRSVRLCHLFLQAQQWPSSEERKLFIRDHCRPEEGHSQVVGSATKWKMTIEAGIQLSLQEHSMSVRSTYCNSSFLDARRSGEGLEISKWICKLLSRDAVDQSVHCSLPSKGRWLETGRQGSGVGHSVPAWRIHTINDCTELHHLAQSYRKTTQ